MADGRVIIAAPSEYDAGVTVQSLPHQIDEVSESIRSFFHPVPLLGRVTAEKLFGELRKGAVGFWFIGHALSGAAGGLVLSDGIVSARSIGRYLATAQVEWSYLNTCDSGALVEALQAVHSHDIYANITDEIQDREATENGVLMSQGIADLGSVKRAYRWVVSGGPSKLRLFPSPDGTGEREDMANRDRTPSYIPIDERLRSLIVDHEIKLARLEDTVLHNKELTLDFVRELRTDMAVLKNETKPLAQAGLLAAAQQSGGGGARWVQVVAVLLVALLVVVVILLVFAAVGGGLLRP